CGVPHRSCVAQGPAKVSLRVYHGTAIRALLLPFTSPRVCVQVQPGHFRVEVVYKKVVAIKVLSEPIEIRLEDLLDRQQRGQQVPRLPSVPISLPALLSWMSFYLPTAT
ncbi:MAG: hypothetical protein MHM6MM_008132, partial [Cercozoa sp. M6MM]